MFKKIIIVGLLVAASFVGMTTFAATATQVVSSDKEITVATNAYDTVVLSQTDTAIALSLSVIGSYPTNSPVVLFTTHYDGKGVIHTNNSATVHCDSSGNLATNLTAGSATVFSGYLFKRDPIYVKFSIATGGAYQVIGELYK